MPTTTAEEISREQVRAFHLSGRGLEHARPTRRIRPAGLDAILAEIPRLEAAYPLYAAQGQAPRPLLEIPGINEAIVREVIGVMGGRPLVPVAEARYVMSRAVEESSIPADGYLVGFHPDAPALIYGAFLTLARRAARTVFSLEVKRCAAGLEDLLMIDRVNRSPRSPDTVTASLGTAAKRFLAAHTLTGIFDRQNRLRQVMDTGRRARCESTLQVLRKALEDQNQSPLFWLFHSGEAPAGLGVFGGAGCTHEDGCAAAIEFCDQQLNDFTAVLRAVRAARLEIESAFDPMVHSALLDQFDWRSAELNELAALPPVVIMVRPEELAGISMGTFARLLCSGRPVHILVLHSGPFEDANVPDFGFLAMAHREAFVLQSSLGRWDHLSAGLVEMARAVGPAIGILSIPEAVVSDGWIETALYDLSGTLPLYRYDPGREGQWAERFELFNPGIVSELTAIQAIAVSNRFWDHFRLIPPSAANDDQVEAGEYFQSPAPQGVPFLAVVDAEGNHWRAVFTRELVDFCRDRGRAAEMLSRLASVPEKKEAVADLEAVRQQGAAEAYAVVMGLLADPEKLIRNARGGS